MSVLPILGMWKETSGGQGDTAVSLWSRELKWYGECDKAYGIFIEEADNYNNDFGGINGSLKPPDNSDIGRAKVLTHEYGDELRFSEATNYIRFNGSYWQEDRQMSVGATKEFLD